MCVFVCILFSAKIHYINNIGPFYFTVAPMWPKTYHNTGQQGTSLCHLVCHRTSSKTLVCVFACMYYSVFKYELICAFCLCVYMCVFRVMLLLKQKCWYKSDCGTIILNQWLQWTSLKGHWIKDMMHLTFCVQNKFCGLYRIMAIQLYLLQRTTSL